MNKLYIAIPLGCLMLFGAYYMHFMKGHRQEILDRQAKIVADIKAKKELELKNRAIAYDEAIKAAAIRKQQREEKERVEAAKREARLQAEELRQKTYDDRKFASEQVDRLKKEVAAVQAEIEKFEEDKKQRSSELTFLKEFVQKAEANQKYYYDLLDKIAAADAARAKADAEAAALAKKNS